MSMQTQSDPKRPVSRVVIADFKGLAPSSDPHDIEPGMAAIMVNLVPIYPGELRVRPGTKVLSFNG